MARILVRPPPDPLAWPGSRLILATDEIIAHGTGPRPSTGFVAKISRDPGQARGSGGGRARIRAIITQYTLEKKNLGETMPKFREGHADYVRPRPFLVVGF
jgi:hypothetical protein